MRRKKRPTDWRSKVVTEALSWIGTPHRHEAMLKGVGVDCARILIASYEAAGILPVGECRPPHYPRDYQLHRNPEYLSWIQKYCDKTEGQPLPGDIAVFHFGWGASHGGIVLAWPRIIHAYVGLGVIVSDVNESILRKKNGESRLAGVYRLRGE